MATAPNPPSNSTVVPEILEVSPPPSDDDGEDTVGEDDVPPVFPALGSAQRAASSSSNDSPRVLTDSQLMPPPPPPNLASRQPGTLPLGVRSSASSSLAVPLTTTKRPTLSPKKREKVALAPGHSPLDWASLKASGADLRGVDTLMRIPPSVLKTHNKKDDAWTAINGKIYNVTPYLSFHPGGEKELMRVAGRDGTKLFALTHAWVNAEFMLDACMVGFLVSEPSS
ncbi:hypothetical protein PILCRDRAFT_817618 [Piloderma croceum F 1598]|uniref:Cytochrome b5 heme-binding domain-containing protein n=1 Tax=Piloderma croceum (strain F 1598) TaxID=765440 RepID=A0A0C3BES4_PILCF|nr:hypothetical protein PILCRDRAFT_817618 [Piloderma croceum F 1598]